MSSWPFWAFYGAFCLALGLVVFAPGVSFWRLLRRLSRRKW